MWILNLILILLAVSVVLRLGVYIINLIFAGNQALGGFRKGLAKNFLPSMFVSLLISGLCIAVQAPPIFTIVACAATFIGTTFILLGNDEDNDQFRKL